MTDADLPARPAQWPADLRLAVWQCEQQSGDVPGNLARLRSAAATAVADGATLLVAPELQLTGYAIGAEAVGRLAEPADGPSARAVRAIAASLGIAIVWGFPERDPGSGAVYNAAQFVDETGVSRATYRKSHLYGALDRAQFTASDEAPGALIHWRGWRIGLLICYDVEFPETVRALALAGADLVLVPTANMEGFDSVPTLLVPARACENGVAVAYANCCGTEGALRYGGLSVVAAPDGRVVARAGRGPGVLCADLALAESTGRRAAILADRRPSLYGALDEPAQERDRG